MRFITKKHLPRRTLLRGAGVTLALPLLDAMLPGATAFAQTAARPVKRFVGVWHPHGASPGYWSPTEEGKDFEFSFITKPLEPFRDRTVLISGLDCTAAYSTPEEPGGNHARGAVFLSGVRPRRDAVSPYLGVTIDQLIAQKHGRDTLLSSIQLGIEDASHNSGNCNWGYSCAYTNSVSWPDPETPLPTEINPRMAFERMFGDGSSPEERRLGRLRTASVLDSVAHEIPAFKRNLAAVDRATLDSYLEDIREIERRIVNATNNPAAEVNADVPFGIPESKDEHFKIMYDLMTLALQADITRSITLMLGRDLSARAFPSPVISAAGTVYRITATFRRTRPAMRESIATTCRIWPISATSSGIRPMATVICSTMCSFIRAATWAIRTGMRTRRCRRSWLEVSTAASKAIAILFSGTTPSAAPTCC